MNDFVTVGAVFGFTLAIGAIAWLLRINYRLAQVNERALHDVSLLQMAVAEARDVFTRYRLMHLIKNTPEGDKKAHSNKELARAMQRVLNATGYHEPSILEKAVSAITEKMKQAGDDVRVG